MGVSGSPRARQCSCLCTPCTSARTTMFSQTGSGQSGGCSHQRASCQLTQVSCVITTTTMTVTVVAVTIEKHEHKELEDCSLAHQSCTSCCSGKAIFGVFIICSNTVCVEATLMLTISSQHTSLLQQYWSSSSLQSQLSCLLELSTQKQSQRGGFVGMGGRENPNVRGVGPTYREGPPTSEHGGIPQQEGSCSAHRLGIYPITGQGGFRKP